MIRNLPMRHAIPLVLVALSLPLAAISYWLEMSHVERDIHREIVGTAAHAGNQIAAILTHNLEEKDIEASQAVLMTLVTLPGLRWAVLVDDTDRVVLSTRRAFRDGDGALPEGPPRELLEEARETLSGQVRFEPERKRLWAVYPVRMPLREGELRSKRIGLVVLAFDTTDLLAAARYGALERASINGAVLLLLALFTWRYLRWALVARAEALTRGLRYRNGEAPKVPSVEGRDELAELARYFTRLSGDLAKRNVELQAQFDHSFQFSGRLAPDGTVLEVNRLALDFVGAKREAVLGRRFWHTPWWTHDPALQQWLEAAVAQAAQGEAVRRNVTHRSREDGALHEVDFSLRPVRDAHGTVLWVLAEGHDVTALRAATTAAEESEQRFRNLVTNVPGAVFRCEPAVPWRMTYLSDGIRQVSGYAPEDFLEERVILASLIHPEDLSAAEAGMAQAAAQREPFELEYRLRGADGTWRWVAERGRPVYGEQGVLHLDGLIIDITARKEAEAQIRRLSAFYATLSQTNTAIVRCSSREELFQRICQVAVEHGGLRGAWIGLVEETSGWLQVAASSGMPKNYLDKMHISIDPQVPEGRGPTGSAIRASRHLVCNDFLDDPSTAAWHEAARAADIRASAAFPLRRGGEVVGSLSLYAGEANFFTEAVIRLLDEMAMDISFALDNFVRQENQVLAETVFDNSREMIVVTDTETRILSVNRAFCEVTGYAREEVLGKPVRLIKSGRHEASFYAHMWDAINTDGYWQGEVWNRRKDGETYPVWASISAVRDEAGRVVRYISVASDITEHKQAEERIRYLAYYDPLTELPNRTLLRDRAEQVLHASARSRREAAMLFLDLDHFKTINDSLGHTAGDLLLQEVGTRIRAALRQSDVVGRLGGDEFLILLPETGADEAAHVAQQLLRSLARPYAGEPHELSVTASIGIVLYPRDGITYDELHKNADIAMYKAKELGRNRTQFFTPALDQAVTERMRLENALRQALANGELSLHFQPQVELGNLQVVGVEALLRWNHPTLGVVSPARFIPIAEESGLIEPIGAWVLWEACRRCAAWSEAGLPALRVAVNVSARQFAAAGLFDDVMSALAASGLAPERLELEITESLLARDLERVLELLGRLKALGVGISVDDFGTGYSSLAYLKRFPLHKLKIDRSFVRDLVVDPEDRAIATAVVNLGHTLGLEVTAEGVETDAQVAILREMGCDSAQGYLFSRPVPADELAVWLKEQ